MQKISTLPRSGSRIFKGRQLTIGSDLGDRWSWYCVLNEVGDIVLEHRLTTTPEAMKQVFSRMPRSRIALETGAHSPWVSRLLTALGHEVIVAHARNVRLIGESRRKDDRIDARTLARLARVDPRLLSPVQHRSAQAQIHLTAIRARAELVKARTALANSARGLVKSYGERLPKCGTQQGGQDLAKSLSGELRQALEPLLREVESLNAHIKEYDRRIENMAQKRYPEVALLKQVKGLGDLIALTYVLTMDDPHRFRTRGRLFCGVAAWAEELWAQRTTDAHQQGGRPLSADAAGARGALHLGTFWGRQ
jgi:transposase